MVRPKVLPVVLVAMALSACANGVRDADPRATESSVNPSSPAASPWPAPTPVPSGEPRYEADALVVEGPDGPAKLCAGDVASITPPPCGTVPITNWDWTRVEGEESRDGSTWGEYYVMGAYDGSSFTVLETGPTRPLSDDPRNAVDLPCPTPEGGWVAPDPARTTEDDLHAAGSAIDAQPDSAGYWVVPLEEPVGEYTGPYVLVAAFTGDLDRHRRELAEIWGGPMCVVEYGRTEHELLRIQEDLTEVGAPDLGFEVFGSATDVVHDRVEAFVVVADGELRAAVDRRYGTGAVLLVPLLRPTG